MENVSESGLETEWVYSCRIGMLEAFGYLCTSWLLPAFDET